MFVELDLITGPLIRVYEEKETLQRKRNAILYSFRPRETSSGKDRTCCLWLGLIPLLTGSHWCVADSLTIVSSCSEFRCLGPGKSLLWRTRRKPTLYY